MIGNAEDFRRGWMIHRESSTLEKVGSKVARLYKVELKCTTHSLTCSRRLPGSYKAE